MKVLLYGTGGSLLALIFLALFVPTTYIEIKVALLLLALVGIVFLLLGAKATWSRKTVMACMLLASFGLANSLHGEINGASGAIRVLSVMFLWPLLYGIFSVMLNRPDAIRKMTVTIKVTFIFVTAYSFLYLGNEAGIIPNALYFELDQGQNVGFYDGTVEYNLYSISSLLFLLPFWMHYLFKLNRGNGVTARYWMGLLAGLALCVLTGRRALQLVVLISPFLIAITEVLMGARVSAGIPWLRNFFNWQRLVVLVCLVAALIYILFLMGIKLDALLEDFMSGFDFNNVSNISASERQGQYVSLMHAWWDGNILFGAGNGSNTDYLRSEEQPWAYELTYIYLLFSTGIVGVIFYFGWFGWGLLRVRYALKQRSDISIYVAPMITGVLGLAIGAASNPYFAKFDYLWIILLPHLLAGAIRYQRKEAGRNHVSTS